MKTFFGLLLLSGVLAVQVSGRCREREVSCGLKVSNGAGGAQMSSIRDMKGFGLKVLVLFLEDQNLDIDSVVCVTKQIVAGYSYRVQYNGLYWVEIYSPLFGEPYITGKGVLSEPAEQPF